MKQIIFSLLIMITATSCYHVYYAPNTAHAPLLSEKGEVRINGLYASGSNSDFEGGEIQAAAAVSKNFWRYGQYDVCRKDRIGYGLERRELP